MRISRWTVDRSGVAAWFGDARPFGPAVAAAAIGLALSVLAWFAVATWEDRLAKEDFAKSAADHAQALQAGLNEYLYKLVALRAFFNGSQHGVTRSEFNVFTKDLLDERKAILSFSWIPRITREERADHELRRASRRNPRLSNQVRGSGRPDESARRNRTSISRSTIPKSL